MRKVLNDNLLNEQFEKDGYVVLPFLSQDEVAELKKIYFDTLPNSGGAIQSDDIGAKEAISYDFTFIDKNIDYKRQVFDIITQRFKNYVDAYLDDYKPIIANFIRKKPKDGEVPLHQNWAFVDERKKTSVSIWCPLVDSNEQNGTLQVVPGSHKRFGEFRGPMVEWELNTIKEDIIKKYLVPMNIKAGQAVILDDSIVHYSASNLTNDLRLAIQLILIPSEEKSIHYHLDPQANPNKIEMLEVDVDFYMQFNPWKKVENKKILKQIPFKPTQLSIQNFDKRIFAKRIDEEPENTTILQKIKSIFS